MPDLSDRLNELSDLELVGVLIQLLLSRSRQDKRDDLVTEDKDRAFLKKIHQEIKDRRL